MGRYRKTESIVLLFAAALSGLALAACEHAVPFDPEARARATLTECASDRSCVHERWHREPRNWNLGLRAEVAWKAPQAPLLVTTIREIVKPEDAACLPEAARASAVYYRTSVSRKGSAEFPFAVFHWESVNQAAVGQKQVLAAVARARGNEERLWRGIEEEASLEAACVRFHGKRDRCQAGGISAARLARKWAKISSAARDWLSV